MEEDLQKLTLNIEYMFLKKVLGMVKDKQLSNQDASTAARAFKALLPFESIKDCQTKTKQFGVDFPLYADLAEYSEAFHEELKTDKIIMQMKEHINNNDIDSALKLAES